MIFKVIVMGGFQNKVIVMGVSKQSDCVTRPPKNVTRRSCKFAREDIESEVRIKMKIICFFKMGQSRPLFVYFRLFNIIQFNKLMKV